MLRPGRSQSWPAAAAWQHIFGQRVFFGLLVYQHSSFHPLLLLSLPGLLICDVVLHIYCRQPSSVR